MPDDRENVIRKLGGKCMKCGISDFSILHVDHKLGQGYLEKEYFKNPHVMYDFYAKNWEFEGKHLQLLCMNCNVSKRISNNETKNRPKLSEAMVFNFAIKNFETDEYTDKVDRDLEEFLDKNRQFYPIFMREIRKFKNLQDIQKQKLTRKSKYKV
jgi:hypothetical protein